VSGTFEGDLQQIYDAGPRKNLLRLFYITRINVTEKPRAMIAKHANQQI
jgi:hypothetical protein